jgi:hypothetical protein
VWIFSPRLVLLLLKDVSLCLLLLFVRHGKKIRLGQRFEKHDVNRIAVREQDAFCYRMAVRSPPSGLSGKADEGCVLRRFVTTQGSTRPDGWCLETNANGILKRRVIFFYGKGQALGPGRQRLPEPLEGTEPPSPYVALRGSTVFSRVLIRVLAFFSRCKHPKKNNDWQVPNVA